VFGPALRNTQRAALAGLPPGAPQLLILGGGTGWVLTEVLRRCPAATVLYLEASPRMLARARARLAPGQLAQVEFRHGTQDALAPDEAFDAVLTFFVLDCISAPDLPGALNRLRAALRPGGRWLLADFRPARGGWRRLLLAGMFWFFRITTRLRARELPDLAAALTARGLHGEVKGRFYGGATEAVVFQ
jgi:tRNA (cmo5U34)-methyltransferase